MGTEKPISDIPRGHLEDGDESDRMASVAPWDPWIGDPPVSPGRRPRFSRQRTAYFQRLNKTVLEGSVSATEVETEISTRTRLGTKQKLEKFAITSMPIDVQPIVAADLRRCAEIEHDAFAESPSYPVLFPGPLPDDPLALRVEGLEKELREDPTVRFLKAVDTELQGDEAIVAWAKFNSYPEGLPVPKPRVPPPGSNAEACTALFVGIDKMRERLMTGKPCVYLHILVTDPKHQRRGAGLQLMTPLMQEAVRLGVPAYLESSVPGHRLYQKAGFRDIDEHRVDFSKFGQETPHLNWAMIWELPNRRCP